MMDTEPMVKMQRHCIENVTEYEKKWFSLTKRWKPQLSTNVLQKSTETERNRLILWEGAG